MTWILYNHFKDKEEEFENTKLICKFLNPHAADKIFDKKGEQEVAVPDDAFLKEVQENASERITTEDLTSRLEKVGEPDDSDDLDVIERVEE